MACYQVALGRMAFSMGVSWEYIEQAVVGTLQGVVLQLGGWGRT